MNSVPPENFKVSRGVEAMWPVGSRTAHPQQQGQKAQSLPSVCCRGLPIASTESGPPGPAGDMGERVWMW